MKKEVLIVGICGRSKSGKSTLAESLSKEYKTDMIEVDHYLKPRRRIPFKGEFRNWELPSNYKLERLARDLKRIKKGKKIKHPVYKFRKGRRVGYRKIKPTKIIFVESYYLFTNKSVRDLIDLKVFLDITKSEFLKRVHPTKENSEWTRKEYLEKITIPEYEKYGEGQRKYADIIFRGTLPKKELVRRLKKVINQRLE